MASEPITTDNTRFLIVRLNAEGTNGTDGIVMASADSEANARKVSEDAAANNPGQTFAVYQKIGTAVVEPRVVWRGVSKG